MNSLIYGRPPAVFDPPMSAQQTSPLIPGSMALEDVAPASVDEITLYAPPVQSSAAMCWRWLCVR